MSLITTLRDCKSESGINSLLPMREGLSFSLLVLESGESFELHSKSSEMALVLLNGAAHLQMNDQSKFVTRAHWQNENPSAAHLCAQTILKIECKSAARFALVETPNEELFSARFYLPEQVSTEHRGKDLLNNAAYRLVRTIFDATNAPPEAKLVLGEVVNFPGCWSSYPPHHHPQNEIYYYEFEPSHGFGFGQCGDAVETLRHQDLLFIEGGKDHAQVSAPGYSMYYLWSIRHGTEVYTGFEYTAPHGDLVRCAP